MHDDVVADLEVVAEGELDEVERLEVRPDALEDVGRQHAPEADADVDVSAEGDWSQVKVWYGPLQNLGGSVYPTYGFVYKDKPAEKKMYAAAD